MTTLSGNLHSSRIYPTHFTCMTDGKLPFHTVYRSVDTIVLERCVRADDEEPTAARRFRFETEEAAKAWYAVWRDCADDPTGDDGPVRVEITFKDPFILHLRHCVPVLDSAFFTVSPV
jgi:hypothetical protein